MPAPSTDVPPNRAAKSVRWFSEIDAADVGSVGGKHASPGEMYGALASQGVRVPNGFASTADAYRHVLDQADAWPRLHKALAGLDAHDRRRCMRPWPGARRRATCRRRARTTCASASRTTTC